MPAITVSNHDAGGLVRIKDFSAAEVDAIVQALQNASVDTTHEWISFLKSIVPDLPAKIYGKWWTRCMHFTEQVAQLNSTLKAPYQLRGGNLPA